MDPRWLKIWHDLSGNKTRTILIVLSIAVGLFAMGTIVSSQAILSSELTKSFQAIHPSTGTVRTLETFDDDFVRSIERMDEVQAADARYLTIAQARLANGEWSNITLFALSDYTRPKLNIIYPQEGAWPPPAKAILIERSALPVLGMDIGDTLLIETAGEKLRELPIAGTVHDLAQAPAQIDKTPYGYIAFETLEWLGEPVGYNELNIVARDTSSRSASQAVTNLVKARVEKAGYTAPMVLTPEPGQLPLNDLLQAILLLMGTLGVLTLFLSAFLIINTVSALLAQQRRQIGIMKAIGATTRQVFGMYLVMVMAYGVLALVLSIPLSIVGSRALCRALAGYFNFDLSQMKVPVQATIPQVVVGLVVPVAASVLPFLSGLRLTAAEAMRSDSMGKGHFGSGLFDRLLSGTWLWFARRVLARPILLSLRNTFRSKGRLVLTLLTLTLAGAIFVSVFGVRSSLDRTIVDLMAWEKFDIMITMKRGYRLTRLVHEAESVPGIQRLEGIIISQLRMVRQDGTETGAIYAIGLLADAELTTSAMMFEGRWIIPDDDNAVVVNSVMVKQEPEIAVGRDLVLKIDGDEVTFRVVGVCMGSSAPMVYLPYGYLTQITSRVGLADQVVVSTAQHDADYVRDRATALATHLRQKGIRLSTVQTVQDEVAEVNTAFAAITALLVVMAALLALVGGLGLMGTMSINVLERTREIGVLRAIGASNRGVEAVFVRESVFVGLISWALGSLLAVPLSKELSAAMGIALLGMPMSFEFRLVGVGAWLVVVVTLSGLASVVPARNAARLTVREVLAYE